MYVSEIWQPITVPKDNCHSVSLGALQAWILNRGSGWHLAFEYGELGEGPCNLQENADVPEDKDWRRWVKPSDDDDIQFAPGLPERPAVIRPKYPVHLPKGERAKFFAGIPICLTILATGKKDLKIFNEPAVKLSNIWFGEMETGELGFTVDSAIRSNTDELAPFTYKAVCPVEITNESEDSLEIKRICIQVKHLALFQGQSQLWTNLVKMKYRGGDQRSEVDIRRGAPDVEKSAQEITKAREPFSGSFTKRTFRSLRSLSDWLS